MLLKTNFLDGFQVNRQTYKKNHSIFMHGAATARIVIHVMCLKVSLDASSYNAKPNHPITIKFILPTIKENQFNLRYIK